MTEVPEKTDVPEIWGRAYTAPGITVYYSIKRCIHFAACVRGLPDVFDSERKPWIMADKASPDEVAEVVRRCPTGALHYVLDDGPAEDADQPTTVDVRKNGPYFVRGDLAIETPTGEVRDTRAALCRCGGSSNKPFCDATHRSNGFTAGGGATMINTN